MQDFSQLLKHKKLAITEQWITAVAESQRIASTEGLPRSAIRDHIDQVLAALVSVLARDQDNEIADIVKASLRHGKARAAQGFNPAEIAQEYHLLRSLLRQNLWTELMQETTKDAVRAIAMIDEVIDAAISVCFQSYMEERTAELQQIQQQLHLTVQELQRLVQVSQDNVSLLAHELKTPLSAMIGYAELFLRQQRKVSDTTELSYDAIERIIRAGRKLVYLINDALEFSQSDDGQVCVKPVAISIAAVLNDIVETMHLLAEEKGLTLTLEIDQAPASVTTDSLKLQQIVINLVSNAIRYTDTGTITVRSKTLSAESWSISIIDTGIGIASEDQSRIFNPFVRATPPDRLPPAESSGLGLSIVERLVKVLHGNIYLTSQVGIGSTFTLILPMHLQA
ncbi:MAG: sensor histidine kinase [Scytolyngbya sp. HA4215-MV1]|jgi:hypothetical protein|nr:sensor histidine kinase [Scytolyngbya sp. HA4215-MV1]